MSDKEISVVRYGPRGEDERRSRLIDRLRNCPIPDRELLLNMGLFLTPQGLSRILYMDGLYRRILEVQGVVMEFGCRWGQNLNLFCALRGIYEPFNRLRKVVGFDTFEGFVRVDDKDGRQMTEGAYAVTEGYEKYLDDILRNQEHESPLSHIRKYEIIKGDVSDTVPQYVKDNPHTIVALAYFDLDLYQPTKDCLEAVLSRMPKGAVLALDEANDEACPGETLALHEVLGIRNLEIKRSPINSRTSYVVM